MSLIERIFEYVTTTIFYVDPTGIMADHVALVDAWALFTTFVMAFIIFVLVIKMIIRLVGKVGSMFLGGRFY